MDNMERNAVRTQWSLSTRLAILIFVLMAIVLSLFAWSADRIIHDSAITRADERLGSIAGELAANSGRSSGTAGIQRLAQATSVRQAVASGDRVITKDQPLDARLDSLLRVRSAGVRTFVARQIWSAKGTPVWGTSSLHPKDSSMLHAMIARGLSPDTAYRSPIFEVNGEMHIWTVASVTPAPAPATKTPEASAPDVQQTQRPEAGSLQQNTLGVLADLRRIAGASETQSILQRLTGADVTVYFTSIGSSDWSSLLGEPIVPPFEPPSLDTLTHRVLDAAGQAQYVVQSQVPGTPWLIVVAQSEKSVLAGAHRFRGNLLIAALITLALGTLGAFWLSRRATRPLVALRDAASDIAHGDYARRVPVGGGSEVASLAQTFNSMARHIGFTTGEMATQNAALLEANEAKTRFLAVMSHELRTPLNAIGGYVELLNLGLYGPMTPEQQESLGKIARNSDRLLALVSDILHYSKLDAGPLTLRRETVLLHEQFTTAAETLAEQFAARNVALVIVPTSASVCADSARLQQVLLNLMTNAVRFTDGGGTVTISSTIDRNKTSIHVTDTGIGIPSDQIESIFRPFVQGDSSLTRRVGGTGLGLTIVRDLCEAMGGRVFATSTVGKGSQFSVVLDSGPMVDEPDSPDIVGVGRTSHPDDAEAVRFARG